MGWHDSLAIKSSQMGKTAADFKSGARRKARTTVAWLIATAAVWYFVSLPWALIPMALAAWNAFQIVSATMIGNRLEKME